MSEKFEAKFEEAEDGKERKKTEEKIKTKELEKSSESFDEKIEKLLDTVADSASEVLEPEVLGGRVKKTKDSIWIVSEGGWRQLCLENEKFPEEALAFVVSRPRYYGREDQIGKIVIPYREGMDKDEEIANTLLHELIHKLGPEVKITVYLEPRHNKETGLIYTMELEQHLGPLKMALRNIISDKEKLIPGVTRQSWVEINNGHYKDSQQTFGEWRLWEAVTGYFADMFSAKIDPDYESKKGYPEKKFIQDLVDDMEVRGEKETTRFLKEGLFNGNDQKFKELLNKYYGSDAYDRLIEIIFKSLSYDEKANNDFKSFLKGSKGLRDEM